MENKAQANVMSRSRFPDGFRIMQGQQEYVTYIDHSSLRIWYDDTPGRYDSHCHSAVEIVMPVKGEVTYRLSEATYRVQEDEVLIVPPNCIHELSMSEGSARHLFLFEPDGIFNLRDMQLVEDMLRKPIYLSGQPELQSSIRGLLAQCVACYGKQPMWNSVCYAYLIQMYAKLAEGYVVRGFRAESGSRRMDPEIVDSARLYIDQNFRRNISLEDVSAFTGFSKYYFSRVFKEMMGISFSEYLRQKRVSTAEELLIGSRQSIQEIAMASGFGSIATFNRVFREAKGCTPSTFREIYGSLN